MQSQHAPRPVETGLLAWDYPPTGSGLATAAREIAESLVARGVRVRVLVLDREQDERVGGVEIIGVGQFLTADLRKLRDKAGVGHLAAPIAFAHAVRSERARRPFDLVEATNWYAPGACIPSLGCPLVTRCSTPVTGTAEVGEPRRVFDIAAAASLERWQATASSGVISNTRHHGQSMASLYGIAAPGEVGPVPHAVIGLSLPPDTRVDLPAPPAGPPWRLLFVGRRTHRKGFDAVTGAASLLGPDFQLRLVGVEPDPVFPKNVRALGRIDDAALAKERAAAHAVLAPSRYESFGLVYQEAIAAGRPVIACAEDPAARSFVGDARTGVLAEDCTGESLATAVRSLLTVPEHYEAARKACAVARHRFSRESLGTETEDFYRRVLQARKGVSNARSSGRRAVSVAPSDIAS